MKTEEELMQIERAQIKHARTTATVLGILAIVTFIAFVYAFFQWAAAEKAAIKLEVCQKKNAEAEERAAVANKKVEQLMIELQISREVEEDANKLNKKK